MPANPKLALQATRATFENVRQQQQTFRKIVDSLIAEKRKVQDDERDVFLETWDRSTFGLGVHQQVKTTGVGYYIKYPNLHSLVYDLAYHDGGAFQDYEGKECSVPIETLWLVLRSHMWQTFGWALDRAVSLSPERIPTNILRAGHIKRQEAPPG